MATPFATVTSRVYTTLNILSLLTIAALINCILIFGAYTRNKDAILIWIILAIVECIFIAVG